MRSRPDVLVLGGGFMLGEAWLTGVLAGLEDGAGVDLRRCEYFVGTSAGSVVAARLAAGRSPRRPAGASEDSSADTSARPTPGARGRISLAEATPVAPTEGGQRPTTPIAAVQELTRAAGAWALAWATPLASLWLAASAPGGALARALALRAIGRGSRPLDDLRDEIEQTGARFDGRLRVAAVDRADGRRVVFGRPAGPAAAVAAAVAASCAVPWLFEPVRIGRHEYVDGAVWSPTNLDAAPVGRGSEVLCLNPIAGLGGDWSAASGHPLAAARIASLALTAVEAGALRRRGATVETVSPDADSTAAIGSDPIATEPAERVLTAGYRQGRRLAVRR